MIPTSDRFSALVRSSGRRRTIVDIYYGNAQEAPVLGDITISAGSFVLDRTADIRRSGSITLSSETIDLTQFDPTQLEIHVRTGFEYANRQLELVSLGWYRTETFRRKEGQPEHLTMDLFDRAKVLQDDVVLVETSTAGKSLATVVSEVVAYNFNGLGYIPTITWDSTLDSTRRLPGGSMAQGTHLDICKLMASTVGGEFFFDADGNIQIKPPPAISNTTTEDDAVWTVDCGEGGILVAADHTTTRAETYNGIGVMGPAVEGGRRIVAQAYDFDPQSPTYYWGPFGRKTKRIEVDTGTTLYQMTAIAQAELRNSTGLAKKLEFEALWNPAVEPGDIVNVVTLDELAELHLIDSINVDLMTGVASCNTRTKQYVA